MIVAAPARVAVVVHLLRRQIVHLHVLRVGNEARQEKAEALYRYIVSPVGTDQLDRIVGLTGDLTDLDATETKAHQQVWRKRAGLIAAIRDAKDQFSDAIDGIIGTV